MANVNGTVLVTVEKGENKRRKDENGNSISATYYTARLSMSGTKAYVNVSEGRAHILKSAGLPAPMLARIEKAITKANELTTNDPSAASPKTTATVKSSVATF